MAGVTTNFLWPFPTTGDLANVAPDMAALAAAIDTTLGSAWTTWNPAWTAVTTPPALGNGVLSGRFKRLGKWGVFGFALVTGTTTTFGTGAWRFSYPPGWQLANTNHSAGWATTYDTSIATPFVGTAWFVTSGPPSTIEVRTHAATTAAGAAVPFTWSSTDVLQVGGVVELV